jgi:aryl-alcohol dehydrogenase-like predicted oxidoreductase
VWPASAAEPDWDAARRHFAGASAAVLRRSLEGSLRRLGTDRIDLYYVHVDDRSTPLEETLATLASFVAEGKVRHLGWSNVRTYRLEAIRLLCEQNGWPKPVALQQQHSYLLRRPGLRHGSIVGDEQLEYLGEHPELSLVAYSPLLKGLYDQSPQERAGNWAFGPYAGESADRRLRAAGSVGEELGASAGQVVLAWLLAQREPQVIPLIGTTKVSRYAESAAALGLELSPEQLTRLDAA